MNSTSQLLLIAECERVCRKLQTTDMDVLGNQNMDFVKSGNV